MSQQSVLKFLQKYPNKYFQSKEIAVKLNLSIGSVQRNLKSLKYQKDVYCLKKNNKCYWTLKTSNYYKGGSLKKC